MATVVGAKLIPTIIKGALLKTVTFSGTVKLDDAGVVRTIHLYRKGFPEILHTTNSDSSGNWSMEVVAGDNDEFRIMAIGNSGENTEIFEHVMR